MINLLKSHYENNGTFGWTQILKTNFENTK